MVNEISKLSRPMTDEDRLKEIAEVLNSINSLEPTSIKTLAICIVSADPSPEEPTRMKATHHVVGSRAEIATMLQSLYGVMGRTFDAEEEAKETPKEKMQ